MNKLTRAGYLVLLMLVLASCAAPMGGGETGTGFDEPVAAKGRITGFGSIFVNGVEFETDSSVVEINDQSLSENELEIGMIVTVHGSVNADGVTGVASAIRYARELEGVVTSSTVTGGVGTLVVMGQTVNVDGTTTYKNDSGNATYDDIDLLTNPHVVEVSGYTDGNGTIYATRVELDSLTLGAGEELELKGLVKSVDTVNDTFQIGGITIHYGSSLLNDLTEADLQAGNNTLYVKVKANSYSDPLIASKIEKEGDGEIGESGSDGEEFDLEGVISAEDSGAGTLTINGQVVIMPVDFDFNTVAPGDKFEVEGTYNSDGILVVEEYESRSEGNVEIKGYVGTIDLVNSQITLLGQAMTINTSTLMKDEQESTKLKYFSITDMQTGDWVEVYVNQQAGTYTITQLARKDPEDGAGQYDFEIEGPITAEDTGEATAIAGIPVDCTSGTGGCENNYSVGNVVDATGTYNGSAVIATIELGS
jgi:hypothetical protein